MHRFLGLDGLIHRQQSQADKRPGYAAGMTVRHDQRVPLRLPARPHGAEQGRDGPARSLLALLPRDVVDAFDGCESADGGLAAVQTLLYRARVIVGGEQVVHFARVFGALWPRCNRVISRDIMYDA